GVVAAELEQAAPEAGADACGDDLPGGDRAGERDERQARVFAHALADVDAAEQEVEDAPGVVPHRGAPREVVDGDRRERGARGGFPEDDVAADGGEGGVPCPDGDGEVEGGDDGDGAERMPLLHHAVARPLRRDGQAVELPAQADGEVADVDHLLDLAEPFGADLPHLQGDELAERLLVRSEQLAEGAHELAALGRGTYAPLLEAGLGSSEGGFLVSGARASHGGELFAEGGLDAGDGRPVTFRFDSVDAHPGEEG